MSIIPDTGAGVEDVNAGRQLVHPADLLSRFGRIRVAARCEDHPVGASFAPTYGHPSQLTGGGSEADLSQAALQQWHDHLALRIAKAAVEFEHFRTIARQH